MEPVKMNFLLIFVAVVLLKRIVQANVVLMPEATYIYISPTAKVDNYILQHQRQFEQQMVTLEQYLADFRKQFLLRLEVIEYYEALVDKKLRDFKDKLDPLEMLGDISDICVEKYRGKMQADSVLKGNLKTCINTANSFLSSLTNNPENTLKNMRTYYNNHFINVLKECKRKHDKNEMKYKSCATIAITSIDNHFTTNTKTFYTQMSTAECGSNTKIAEIFACYSLNVYQTFTTIGEVNALIDNCLAAHHNYSLCEIVGSDDIMPDRCPYKMVWHLAEDDFKSDINPFKGINNTIPCLQINFVNQTFINDANKP